MSPHPCSLRLSLSLSLYITCIHTPPTACTAPHAHTLPTRVPHVFALYKHTSYPHLTRWEAFRASVSVSHSWAKEEVRPPPTHATGRGLGAGRFSLWSPLVLQVQQEQVLESRTLGGILQDPSQPGSLCLLLCEGAPGLPLMCVFCGIWARGLHLKLRV